MSAVELTDGPDRAMVWHYGDPLAEQRAMLAGGAATQLGSREVFTINGPERLAWLHSLTSQQLADLGDGTGADALVLSPSGQIEFGLSVIDRDGVTWCWTEPGRRDGLVGWLESMKFWTQVDLAPRDDVVVWWLGAVVEPPAEAIASRVSAVAGGREALLPVGVAPLADSAGQWAHEALRLEAGVPRIGIDTDERCLPNEIGLYGTAIDKGCYRGQETVARVHNLGRPPRRLVRLLFDGDLPEPGAAVIHDDRSVGTLTSAVQHYELGPIGLALVKRSVPVDAVLETGAVAASQEILVDPEAGLHFRPTL